MSKPRLLPFRVPPRRRDDGVPQPRFRQPPLERRHDLAIAHAVESGRVRRDAAGEQGPHLGDEARREHPVHPLRDAAVERVARQRQMNVPRSHNPGLARLALPPAQRPTAEQRHLDRARRALASPPPKPPANPPPPMAEPPAGQPPTPNPKSPPPPRANRRLAEQPLRQCSHVEPGPTDDDRFAPAGPDAPQPTGSIACEPSRAVALPRLDQVEAEVGNPRLQLGRRLCRADVEPAVYLPRIG